MLTLHKIKEFVNLVERVKIVEQALGLDKKDKSSQVYGKRVETIGSQPLFKWNREYRDSEKSILPNVDIEKDHVKPPSVFIGKIKKLKKDIIISNCEICGKKHESECWKKTEAFFWCGSL